VSVLYEVPVRWVISRYTYAVDLYQY
jgi:hypothetical protein